MTRILVTGSSGHIGHRVAQRLAAQGLDPRLLRRQHTEPSASHTAEIVLGDFDDLDAMAKAFDRVDAVFLYTPAKPAARLLQLAASQGVQHVVLLSSASVAKVAPGTNPVAERHRQAEQAVIDAGLSWTFLRPDTLATNALQWSASIRAQHRVEMAYPQAQRNPIHEDDVAWVACEALLSDRLNSRALHLSGPAVLTQQQQVEAIASAIGKPIDCVDVGRDRALVTLRAGPKPVAQDVAERLLDYLQKSITVSPGITPDFEQVTGHPPRTFAGWALDHTSDFLPTAGEHHTESP